ncbi:MAG TPA: STAS domain-containing protein [Solirubrobacteraceae bacterium]|nr:STAS domain-containing protein [Solirubrobacteraceae bacterium]
MQHSPLSRGRAPGRGAQERRSGNEQNAPSSAPGALPQSDVAPAERAFRVELHDGDQCAILEAIGEFDSSALTAFEQAISRLLREERPIVVDLSRVTFIDSSGLWAITLTQRICRRQGIGLLIKPGPERVQSVFEVTGLYDLLPFTSGSLAPGTA